MRLAVVSIVVLLTGSLAALNSPGAAQDPIAATEDDLRAYLDVTTDMHTRWVTLDGACDADAVFSLLYLVTTAKVGDLVAADHFEDNPFLVAWDRDFADRYFAAYDAYHAGKPTPEPWRIAFEHADSGTSTVTEDLLLGMNAHVNYDLAFSAYSMGLPQNGQKDEYDRVNDAFWNVVVPVSSEMSTRYEGGPPRSSDKMSPQDEATVELLISWREAAWGNAQLLANAPGPLARQTVALSIEAEAASIARGIAQNQEPTRNERVAHCEASGHPELAPELGGPGYGNEWFDDGFEKRSFLICHQADTGQKTLKANEHSWTGHEHHGDHRGEC